MLLQLPSPSRVTSLLPTTPQGASSGAELVTSDGRALSLVSAHLRGEARGGLARLVLEQRFENTYDETLRVTYRMPLPADGAVSGYAFEIGDRVIKGVVDRKAAARERFETAIASGKTAALLEQDRADIFTQQIGNIPANEAVIARITIDQRLVWLPEGEWELRFPTVIGPRYIGSADTVADVRATHIKVADQELAVRFQIELAIGDAIVAGAKPSSPSHAIDKRADGMIELRSSTRLDRDIVVRWPVATPAVGLSLDVARPSTGSAHADAFGLLTIVPPAREAKPVAVARDLIVLLDTSGSMDGGPLDKAKQVVALLIDSLDDHDRLELIEFSSQPRRYKPEPIVATAKARQDAIRWVRSRTADGGTEMRAAVIEALQTLRIGAQRQVVVVTDGYVGGEQQILDALHRRMPKSCRLHVLGVGSAVNRSLATSLARAGRGCEVLVGNDEDAERGAKRLLDRTRSPMLTNVEIAGSALLRHAPEQIPDVFEGAPLVAALALRAEGGELVVRGQLARDTWEQRIVVPARALGEGNQAIVALYGRERVADVESHAMFDSVDGEIEDLGLTFQIATRMTSWVAVDDTRRVTGRSRSELIPQELPYGTKASAFGLRGAAMPAPMQYGMDKTVLGGVTAVVDAKLDIGESYEEEFAGESPTGEIVDRVSGVAPPASLGRKQAAYRDDIDDDVDASSEPPADVFDEREEEAKKEITVVTARSVVTRPAPAAEPAPAPAPAAPRFDAPAERRPARPTTPEPVAQPAKKPAMSEALVTLEAKSQARPRTSIWAYVFAAIALALAIAALIWWLLR
jgi:Ca-activated chloride channel family protein